MGRKARIDKEELRRYLNEGKSQAWCARFFKVTEGAITRAIKKFKIETTKALVSEEGKRAVKHSLDAVDQLYMINEKANGILEKLEQSKKRPDQYLILKACSEIRGQLSLQMEIYKTLYDMKAIVEFQEEVLNAISEVQPEVRERIIKRLNQRRALAESISID